MIWLASFAASLVGRLSIVGAGVAALLVAYKTTQYTGVKKERERVEKQGKQTDAQAGTKRAAAERNPDGMLKRYYRD